MVRLTHVFQVDTTLFVLLSGFTTGLQTGASRGYVLDDPLHDTEQDTVKTRLKPKFFDWKNFLITRAVGVFPILWLVLLVSLPSWIEQQNKHDISVLENNKSLKALNKEHEVAAMCGVLHVVALSTWWRYYTLLIFFAELLNQGLSVFDTDPMTTTPVLFGASTWPGPRSKWLRTVF